jgi:hypothetical protein
MNVLNINDRLAFLGIENNLKKKLIAGIKLVDLRLKLSSSQS